MTLENFGEIIIGMGGMMFILGMFLGINEGWPWFEHLWFAFVLGMIGAGIGTFIVLVLWIVEFAT